MRETKRRDPMPAQADVDRAGAGDLFNLARVTARLDDVRRFAHAHGGTVNDAMLAVITGAVRTLLDGRGESIPNLVVSVPVSARGTATTARLGNQIGALPVRLRYSTDPRVSRDIIGDAASCVFDSGLTQAGGDLVKVFGWYDNEWGYANRLVEMAQRMA